jgi:hypothetical protein
MGNKVLKDKSASTFNGRLERWADLGEEETAVRLRRIRSWADLEGRGGSIESLGTATHWRYQTNAEKHPRSVTNRTFRSKAQGTTHVRPSMHCMGRDALGL